MPRLRFGFWVDVVCGSLGLALAIVTVFVPDWIEVVSGVDPDRGDGLAEWALVGVLLVGSTGLAFAARREWRHAHSG